jgi:hypothetical protein
MVSNDDPPLLVCAPFGPEKIEQEVLVSQATAFKLDVGTFVSPPNDVNVMLEPEMVAFTTAPPSPTIMHMVLVGHEIALSEMPLTPVEAADADQVPPELVNTSAFSELPTTRHSVDDAQLTAAG